MAFSVFAFLIAENTIFFLVFFCISSFQIFFLCYNHFKISMQIFDTRGGASMLQQQRHDIILSILAENGTVHTADLVKRMDVSSETIRKDLDYLEKA